MGSHFFVLGGPLFFPFVNSPQIFFYTPRTYLFSRETAKRAGVFCDCRNDATTTKQRFCTMSKQVIRSLVEEFISNGGQITVCPARVALGSPQLRPLNCKTRRQED